MQNILYKLALILDAKYKNTAVFYHHGGALPFGCRNGECGTCVVEIVQGMEFLSEINEKEKKVLKEAGVGTSKQNLRLSCQMKIIKLNGVIHIKY
jgi:ferredoxin